MRTFTAVYFELNGYINMSFRRSKASSGLKYFFFQFYHRNFCKLISICKRHSQGYCGQPLTKIVDSKLSLNTKDGGSFVVMGILMRWQKYLRMDFKIIFRFLR